MKANWKRFRRAGVTQGKTECPLNLEVKGIQGGKYRGQMSLRDASSYWPENKLEESERYRKKIRGKQKLAEGWYLFFVEGCLLKAVHFNDGKENKFKISSRKSCSILCLQSFAHPCLNGKRSFCCHFKRKTYRLIS